MRNSCQLGSPLALYCLCVCVCVGADTEVTLSTIINSI